MDRNGETTSQRESTPSGQKPGEEGSKEKPGEKPGDGSKPSNQNGGEPKLPLASKADAHNAASSSPAKPSTGAGSTADGTDRWGDLPVYARDVFRAQGGDALPMRYRDFIDGYYRRLNEPR